MAVKKNAAAKAAKETTEKAVKAAKETTEKAVKAAKEMSEKAAKSAQETKAKDEVFFEFAGRQFNAADVEKKVRKACGKKASEIKSLKIYVKAEDFAAYYVVNGSEAGKIDL